jgi:site-specific DNA-methyltransferase (adenine-specific)
MATAHRSKKPGKIIGVSKANPPHYKPVLELPPLPFEQYTALRDNIGVNGVLVPILVDCDGPLRRIIDGNHRKAIADELGCVCPEIVKDGLTDQEKRLLARALNLARRQLTQEQKREIVIDQLRETPGRSNNWVGKQLGAHHATVAAVRASLESTCQIDKLERTMGADGKSRPTVYTNGSRLAEVRGKNRGADRDLQEPQVSSDRSDDSQEVVLDDFDEEAILRAAAEIRQRRVVEQLRSARERRQATRPTASPNEGTPRVLHGDCNDLIPTLEDGTVALVITSPPYADQRSGHYQGIPEKVYPDFTVRWMESVCPKLREDASVFVVIRPHLRGGILSDYVLRTRLALREAGWNECEELIWYKPDAPPLGSIKRPRRTWESILWFARAAQPFSDLTASGRESDCLGFIGSLRFGVGGDSPVNNVRNFGRGQGIARVSDVIQAPIGPGAREPGVDHPAMFPVALADQLIRTFSQEGDLVLDPFCGSGQTLLAAKNCGRRFLGIDREERYVEIALERLGR